jgi:hypothetical protein
MAIALTSFNLILRYAETEQLTNKGSQWALIGLLIGGLLPFTNMSAVLPFTAIILAVGASLVASRLYFEQSITIIIIGVFGMALVILSFMIFGVSMNDMEFRPIPIMATYAIIAVILVLYSRYFMDSPVSNFVAASAIMLGFLGMIDTNQSREISVAFHRLNLWLWIPAFLVFADMLDKGAFWFMQKLPIHTKAAAVLCASVLVWGVYSFQLNTSMSLHSSLTPETEFAMEQVDGKGAIIGVFPESLRWHLERKTDARTLGHRYGESDEFTECIKADCDIRNIAIKMNLDYALIRLPHETKFYEFVRNR